MNRKAFRKIFLPGVIFLFSVLVLGQSTWACDEPDYNDYLCVEELDIKRVRLDFDNDLIYIVGKNFDNGGAATVILGDIELSVKSHKGNEIVTNFPGVEEGQYKLRVSTGDGYKCKDKYSVKIDHDNKPSCPPPSQTCPEGCKGAKGDPGEPGKPGKDGEPGQPGPGVESAEAITLPPGSQATASLDTKTRVLTIGVPQGDPGVKSAVAVTVDSSKSATASLDTKTSVLTIEVPRGAAGTNGRDGKDGAPGILGWRIVEFVVLGKNDDDLYVGEALCDTDNGYALTGGGFQAPLGVVAIVSRPLKATYTDESNKTHEIGIGWRVVGEIRGDYNASPLTVYAVCACVDADVCGQ